MIEGEENCSAGEERREGEGRRGEVSEMDGWTDKTETAAAQQRTHIPCKKGCEGEQVWLRATERDPDKGRGQKNGGGGLWLSGLALR